MLIKQAIAVIVLSTGSAGASAQLANQVELRIEPSNRTLTVNAEDRVTADPEIAILHIGFETVPTDAKAAYASGAKTSGEIIAALKQAGIPESSIRSETQHLDRVYDKPHKFKLVQQWTVKTPPERVAEILDIAISAGATESGEIDWTVKDEKALEAQALDHAAVRAKTNAAVLAAGIGEKLGKLIYVSNQISAPEFRAMGNSNNSYAAYDAKARAAAPPLSIEPRKVSRTATVYAVFAIE